MRKLLVVIAFVIATNAQAASEDECAIYLCLPSGFLPVECLPAKGEMVKRLAQFKSPLPSFDSCQVEGSPASGLTASMGPASRLYRIQRGNDWAVPDPLIVYQSCNEGRLRIGPNNFPCTHLDAMMVLQNGVPLGKTYFRAEYGPDYTMDPVTGEIEKVTDAAEPEMPTTPEPPAPEPVEESVTIAERNIPNQAIQSDGSYSPMANGFSFGGSSRVNVSNGVITQTLVPAPNGSLHDQGRATIHSGAKVYTVDQSFKFDADFSIPIIGKLGFGLGDGRTSAGRLTSGGVVDPKSWTVRPFMKPGSRPDTMRIGLYSYASNRTTRPYGDEILLAEIPKGSWNTTRMEVGLNSAGQSDGTLKFWVNGQQVLNKTGVQWRGQGTPGDSMQSIYSSMSGGNGPQYRPDGNQRLQISDVNVSWSN